VNNAGINNPTDFDQVTDADWDEILSVNLKGPFICAQEALPLLGKHGKGLSSTSVPSAASTAVRAPHTTPRARPDLFRSGR
jgi:3-oxoacyl-[acyl-carrier protein] reductase